MVRVKYRYVVIKVELEKNNNQSISLSNYSIYNCIVKCVQKYYGEMGVASMRYGFKTKYCNDQTRIAIVRVKHRIHRFVTSVLPLVSVLGEHLIKLRSLYNGATIIQCNKFIVEYQKNYLDSRMADIASAGERKNLIKSILSFKTVD